MTRRFLRWVPAVRESDKPAYLAIADAIAEDVQRGQLAASERLPTLRQLAGLLGLNFATVARGYAEARRRGLIESTPGKGTFIRQIVRSQPVSRPSHTGLIDMTMNMPPEPEDPAMLQRMRAGFAALAEMVDLYSVLRYQEVGGTLPDREAGARWLARNLPGIPAHRVLVCPGVQSALLALFTVLGRPGDTICCEAVTYPGIKGIAAHLGIRLQGLPVDDAGIDPDAFAAACAILPPKALYLNPTLLNPTTAVMSRQRREAVATIAQRYSVPIIEDDAYGRLPLQPPVPLATLAPELTFYITGFAKCVGAGLRVAYVCTPNVRYTARLAAILRTTVVMPTTLSVAMATRWINDGTADVAASAVREESRARQATAAEVLGRARYSSKPEAFHLWLSVPEPWSRVELATHLRSQGVGVVLSDTFTVSGTAPEAVRICLGGPANRQECRHSLEIIDDALRHVPALSASS